MRRLVFALVGVFALAAASSAYGAGWTSNVPFSNQVASVPVQGAGYPDPDSTPDPGTCVAGPMNSNRSESWIAVQPGTENAVGTSKFFFDKYSTFYNFYLGAYTIKNGRAGQNTFLPGYDCITTGSQEMPPSWTNNTDPNVDFDSQGRAYQISLPFNAYWTNLHPNGSIVADYSDDLGKTWTRSAGADKFGYVEFLNNQTTLATGGFEDKQWVAVNHFATTKYRDHVYAMWAIFNGQGIKLRESVSRDRGLTYSLPVTITSPSDTGPSNFAVYPSVDAAGDLYVRELNYHDGAYHERIQKRDAQGNWSTIATTGSALGQVAGYPAALAVDAAGNLYDAEAYPGSRLQRRDAQGNCYENNSLGPVQAHRSPAASPSQETTGR